MKRYKVDTVFRFLVIVNKLIYKKANYMFKKTCVKSQEQCYGA